MTAAVSESEVRVERVPLRLILPNPLQPRQIFSDEEIDELALAIKEHGILHMPVVRSGALISTGERGFYLIAGHRRTLAAERAGFYEIDVVVRNVTPLEAGVLAAVENVSRVNLSPLEEADMILSLLAAGEVAGTPLTLNDLSRKLGKGRGREWIMNRADLRGMGEDVQAMITERPDTLVHARAIDAVSQASFRKLLIDFTSNGGPYLPLREFTRYVAEAGSGASEEALRELVEFYQDKRSMLKKNLAALVERVDRLIKRDRPAKVPNAPDSQTSRRRHLNEQTGGGGMSRGQLLVGSSPTEINSNLVEQLETARAALLSAGRWREQLKATPTKAHQLILEIRSLLERLENDEKSPGE